MNYRLINVIREEDNGNMKELMRLAMYVDLILEPKLQMSLTLEKGGKFYIEHIEQDLKNKIVTLYQFTEICHREFWDEKFWGKYKDQLFKEGWMKTSKVISCSK